MANFFVDQRVELDLTQKQIADSAGYGSYAAVSAWEREVAAPSIAEADNLAAVYKVSAAKMREEIAKLSARVAAAKSLAASR